MNYYKDHSQEFIDDTINCDMSEQYRFFEKYLNGKGTILDVGFGSGRDSLYFKSKGYEVYAIDPEESFVKHAKELGLDNVYQLKVEDMIFEDMFDGIWACASLLHIPSQDLRLVLEKCSNALKNNGVIYASFKYGDFEGIRNERYYLDVNEISIKKYLLNIDLEIIDMAISQDVRQNRNDKWMNLVLRKKYGC